MIADHVFAPLFRRGNNNALPRSRFSNSCYLVFDEHHQQKHDHNDG
nr:MAG TPA: hypothetical protein [Caudoviricetes sp.]